MNQKNANSETRPVPAFLQYCTEDSPRLALFKLLIQNESQPDFDVSKTIQTLKKKVYGQRPLNEPDMLEDLASDVQYQFVDKSSRLHFTAEQFRMFKQRAFNAKAFQGWLTMNASREGLEGEPYCYVSADLYAIYKALDSANKVTAFQAISQGVVSGRIIPVQEVEGFEEGKQNVSLPPLKKTPAKTPKIVRNAAAKPQKSAGATSASEEQKFSAVQTPTAQRQPQKATSTKASPLHIAENKSEVFPAGSAEKVKPPLQKQLSMVDTPRTRFALPAASGIARVPSPADADQSSLMMETIDMSKSRLQYLAQEEVDARHIQQQLPRKSGFDQESVVQPPIAESAPKVMTRGSRGSRGGTSATQRDKDVEAPEPQTPKVPAPGISSPKDLASKTVVHMPAQHIQKLTKAQIVEEIDARKRRIAALQQGYEALKRNKKETFLYSVDVMGYVGDVVEGLEEIKACLREHQQTIAFIKEFEIDDSQ